MTRDIKNIVKPIVILGSKTAETCDTQNVDRKGYESLMFMDIRGAGSWTSSNHVTVKMEHSDDGTDFTEVPAALMQGEYADPQATTTDRTVATYGYLGDKRYVRLSYTLAGTVTDETTEAIAILGHPQYTPV